MIDTIRLGYRITPELDLRVKKYHSRLSKVSPSGEILYDYEKPESRNLPSSFDGIHIDRKEIRVSALGREFYSELFIIELSLQKYYDRAGYNDMNVSFTESLFRVYDFISRLSVLLDFKFSVDCFKVLRVDFSENYEFCGVDCTVYDFIQNLDYKFSRAKAETYLHRYPSAIYYPSRWITKKIYVKYDDYINLCKKNKQLALQFERVERMKNMIRLEMEFKSAFLRKNKLTKIHDMRRLRKHFQEEKNKLMTTKILSTDYDNYADLKKITFGERTLINMVKEVGFSRAKILFCEQFTKRHFYRLKRSLQEKGIHIECVDMSVRREYRELVFQIKEYSYNKIKLPR